MASDGPIRRAAFAGSWYPDDAGALRAMVDACLEPGPDDLGEVVGLVAPHAGMMYSGAVGGFSYRAASRGAYDIVVLVGPSHYAAFRGVAVSDRGAFECPLGRLAIDEPLAHRLASSTEWIRVDPHVHAREHSLELQLPFLARVLPAVPILPMIVGSQRPEIVKGLGDALVSVLEGRRPLLVASSDLSHYHPRAMARRLDGVVLDCLERFDPGTLQRALEHEPDHACGGGPIVAVLRVAQALGATGSRVLRYGDSGDVSGDTEHVVGYVSAAFGVFEPAPAA